MYRIVYICEGGIKITREDFHVGQTVYLLREKLNYREDSLESRIKEVKVKSIGRKYLTVDYYGDVKFDMTNNFIGVTNYTPIIGVFLNKEDIFRIEEIESMQRYIRQTIDWHLEDLSYEELQSIQKILQKFQEAK